MMHLPSGGQLPPCRVSIPGRGLSDHDPGGPANSITGECHAQDHRHNRPVSSELTDESPVLLEEHVHSVHLSSGHAAAQLVERLAWAVSDAEHAEDTHLTRAAR